MSAVSRVVLDDFQHRHQVRGDVSMEEKQKYAATYQMGNTVVHVVAPPPMSEEEKNDILKKFHLAGWAIIEELEQKKEEQGS